LITSNPDSGLNFAKFSIVPLTKSDFDIMSLEGYMDMLLGFGFEYMNGFYFILPANYIQVKHINKKLRKRIKKLRKPK